MHFLKILSILFLIVGIVFFVVGIIWYWNSSPPYGYTSALITIGLLFILGSIIILCISLQYDMKSPIEQLRAHAS